MQLSVFQALNLVKERYSHIFIKFFIFDADQ